MGWLLIPSKMARQYSKQPRAVSSSRKTATEDEEHEIVKVYWMPREISQSHEQESKACTLITVLVVLNCQRLQIDFSRPTPTPDFIDIFSHCIKRGNNIYEKLREDGTLRVKYLNIPEALEAVKRETKVSVVEWKNLYFEADMIKTLHHNIEKQIELWRMNRARSEKSNINVVILANLRAVVLIISRVTGIVTLADSHGHNPYGAVIAQSAGCKLANLCKWYAFQLTKDTGPVTCYELSFLYCV